VPGVRPREAGTLLCPPGRRVYRLQVGGAESDPEGEPPATDGPHEAVFSPDGALGICAGTHDSPNQTKGGVS
jgi:hypothetical protein